jgi:hypothetical protein
MNSFQQHAQAPPTEAEYIRRQDDIVQTEERRLLEIELALWRAWVSPGPPPGEQLDGTFVVPSIGKPAAGGSQPPTAVSADFQTADIGNHGSTNGSNGHAAVAPMPAERPKSKLEDALKTVVAAVFAATQYAKQIGYQIPPFTSEDIRTMADTLMIQHGGGK